MNPILKNVLAVIAGCLLGGIVNSGLIELGHRVMPIAGLDTSDLNSYASIFPNLEPKYFIFPFIAHALGTLVGAIIAARLAANRKTTMALIVGVFFLIGGILASYWIPAPAYFMALDILLAYIPMAWIGGKLGTMRGNA